MKKKKHNIVNLILFVIVCLLLIGCQTKDNTIYFKEDMVLQYGTNEHPLSLIEKVGNTKITKDMISNNILNCGNVSIKCEPLDTSLMGKYDVTYTTNDSENHLITKTITVTDTIAPHISFKGLKNGSLELTDEQFKKYNFAQNITVSDNYDSSPKTKVSVKKRNTDKEYIILVEAVDQFQNKSKSEFIVRIKKEEQKKDESTKSQNQNNQSHNSSKNNSSHKNNESTNSSTKPQKYPRKSQTFYFGKVYELNGKQVECSMDNVSMICSSRMSGNSECIPLKDANGIYIGMQLNFK